MAQNGIITHTRNHRRHQLVDKFTGGGEAIHTDTTFGLLIENDVVQVIAIVPDAELRTHPIMTDRRAKHFRTSQKTVPSYFANVPLFRLTALHTVLLEGVRGHDVS